MTTPHDAMAGRRYFCTDLGEVTLSKDCRPYEKATCGNHRPVYQLPKGAVLTASAFWLRKMMFWQWEEIQPGVLMRKL
jgi:hypothetical protein